MRSLPALALLAAVALAGCGSQDGVATTTAPAVPAGPAAGPATLAGLDLALLDRSRLPGRFPADVVLADGELQLLDPVEDGWAALVVTTYPAELTADVAAGAADLLVQAGWTVPVVPTGGSTWQLEKDGARIDLSGYPDTHGAALNYSIDEGLS